MLVANSSVLPGRRTRGEKAAILLGSTFVRTSHQSLRMEDWLLVITISISAAIIEVEHREEIHEVSWAIRRYATFLVD